MEFFVKIKGKPFYDLSSFAEDMYLFPQESIQVIKSTNFLKYLYNFDKKLYNNTVELLKKPFQAEELIFKVQYILNPIMSLRYHKYKFDTLEELGYKIISYGPKIDIYLKDFIKCHLLSHYMLISGLDERKPTLFHKIIELEKEFLVNENRAYFKLGFILQNNKKISYKGKIFQSPQDFLNYVKEPSNITEFSNTFISSQYIQAYLDYLGYHKELTLFDNLVNAVLEKEREHDNHREV